MRTLSTSIILLLLLGISAEPLTVAAATRSTTSSSVRSVRAKQSPSIKSTTSKKSSSKNAKEKSLVTFAITNDWQTTWGFLGDNKNGNVTIHTENKPAFIRAELPKGSFWGVEVKQPKSGVFGTATGGFSPSERIVLTYDIRLPKGFQYGRGGFLPCIYGGRSISKINISCSLIWDKNESIGLYTDFPNMMNDDVYLSMTTETLPADDEWHTLQIEGSMNTATKGNGTIRLSLDGEQILISNKVMFRTKPTDRFEGISFNAFYRSRNAAVQDASPVDTYIDFANISLKTK